MAADAMYPPSVNKVAWARQVAVSTGLPEDLAYEALDRVLAAMALADMRLVFEEGPRRQAERMRRFLTRAIAEARRLQAARVDEAVRLPVGHDPRLSEAAARELYHAIVAEVPEVAAGVVRVVRIVRARGLGAKVAVTGQLPGGANVGSFVGVGGARVRAIRERLYGDRVDVVVYDSDPVAFTRSALRPGQVIEVWQEGSHAMVATCLPEAMAGVIGAEGLNVMLASTLVRARLSVQPV